jgi:signal recognition particle GTPase
MDQFEAFETRRFVGRLLGRGDVSGLMDKIQVRVRGRAQGRGLGRIKAQAWAVCRLVDMRQG